MLFGVDDSQALRAEQRLRDDKLALAEAKRALAEQCRRTLTRPSTLAILLVVGGLLGARPRWGRDFVPDDARQTNPQPVLIDETLAEERFGDPAR
ncbi:MAG: hypothetical protein ABI541_04740, partial [Betaproteobacteria bacterium]